VGAWAAVAALSLAAESASAEPPPVGFADRPPAVDRERDVLFTDAVGLPDTRIERWDARRVEARRRAAARARAALHAFVDAALARAAATPRVAATVHAALDEAVVEVGRRPLTDGGAVVRLAVPLGVLRDAARPLELAL